MSMFLCTHCGQDHDEIPSFHADRPTAYWDVPESKRESDIFLTTDSCVIAERFFFIRGLLEIPIIGQSAPFTWGVWTSLSEVNFFIWQENYDVTERSHVGPFFGWLCTKLPIYPDTRHLKSMVHLQNEGLRPRIELEQSEHPLSIEQHQGITLERALAMVHILQDENKD